MSEFDSINGKPVGEDSNNELRPENISNNRPFDCQRTRLGLNVNKDNPVKRQRSLSNFKSKFLSNRQILLAFHMIILILIDFSSVCETLANQSKEIHSYLEGFSPAQGRQVSRSLKIYNIRDGPEKQLNQAKIVLEPNSNANQRNITNLDGYTTRDEKFHSISQRDISSDISKYNDDESSPEARPRGGTSQNETKSIKPIGFDSGQRGEKSGALTNGEGHHQKSAFIHTGDSLDNSQVEAHKIDGGVKRVNRVDDTADQRDYDSGFEVFGSELESNDLPEAESKYIGSGKLITNGHYRAASPAPSSSSSSLMSPLGYGHDYQGDDGDSNNEATSPLYRAFQPVKNKIYIKQKQQNSNEHSEVIGNQTLGPFNVLSGNGSKSGAYSGTGLRPQKKASDQQRVNSILTPVKQLQESKDFINSTQKNSRFSTPLTNGVRLADSLATGHKLMYPQAKISAPKPIKTGVHVRNHDNQRNFMTSSDTNNSPGYLPFTKESRITSTANSPILENSQNVSGLGRSNYTKGEDRSASGGQKPLKNSWDLFETNSNINDDRRQVLGSTRSPRSNSKLTESPSKKNTTNFSHSQLVNSQYIEPQSVRESLSNYSSNMNSDEAKQLKTSDVRLKKTVINEIRTNGKDFSKPLDKTYVSHNMSPNQLMSGNMAIKPSRHNVMADLARARLLPMKENIPNGAKNLSNSLSFVSIPDRKSDLYDQNSQQIGHRLNSIVRSGAIVPNPMALGSIVPAAMALLARSQLDPAARANQLTALLASSQRMHRQYYDRQTQNSAQPDGELSVTSSNTRLPKTAQGNDINSNNGESMVANANQAGVSHSTPSLSGGNLGTSESNSYNSIANIQDYPDRSMNNGPSSSQSSMDDSNEGRGGTSHQVMSYSGDDQRSDYQSRPFMNEGSSYDSSGVGHKMSSDSGKTIAKPSSDYYIKSDRKTGDSVNLRSSLEPYEDISSNMPTSEYERDLADLDEEFTRHSGFRRPASGSLMSDSYMSLSPERYEVRPNHYSRRPNYDYSSDYLNAAGSIASLNPRVYSRTPGVWPSSGSSPPLTYADNQDLWPDSNIDFGPLASLISPSQLTYRIQRPRYQRMPSATYATSPYHLTTSASEQQLQPAYNIVPSYASSLPTESISFTLSPLAAAAAAAATALAAADKSRHNSQGATWLTLPRIASSLTAPAPATAAATPSHTAAIAPAVQPATYVQRPSPYVLSSMPIYTIAPRPTAPLTTAASGATPSIMPYFPGAAPAFIAYRPTGAVLPAAPLFTAASFAYPLRIPVAPQMVHRPTTAIAIGSPVRGYAAGPSGRPMSSDLQLSETKARTNLNSSSSSDNKGAVKMGSFSAMAKNLTKKMFGSASQVRPQHIAPPGNIYDALASAQNSSLQTLSLNYRNGS